MTRLTTATVKGRVHYVPDCDNTAGNDSLAVTTAEALLLVNCAECVHVMHDHGLFAPNDETVWI